jgi:hypothetical protein
MVGKSDARKELMILEKSSHRPRERKKLTWVENEAAKEKWFCKRL